MAKLPRPRGGTDRVPAYRTFFVTSSTWERRQLFRHERMALLLADVFVHSRERCPYQLHEFTVMPEHFHLLITLEPEGTLERAMQLIKGGFSYRASKELQFKGGDLAARICRSSDSRRAGLRDSPGVYPEERGKAAARRAR